MRVVADRAAHSNSAVWRDVRASVAPYTYTRSVCWLSLYICALFDVL